MPFFYLSEEANPSVELLPVAPCFLDPFASSSEPSPTYFSDVIVNSDSLPQASRFADIRGSRWCYNDPCSLSGYYITLQELQSIGETPLSFFSECQHSGGHLESLRRGENGMLNI